MRRLASPFRPNATADVRDLVTAVRKFQVRASTVFFVKHAFSTIAIGAAGTMVWNLAAAPTEQGRWTALLVTLAIGLVSAAILSYLRAPTLGATAAAIDRRLLLQDRIVAALQVGRESDPMSALVVRDAAAYLAASTPADVFPLDLGRRAVVGTLLLAMALLTVTIDVPRAASSRPPGTGAGAVALARPEGVTDAAASPNDAEGAAAAAAPQPASANARPTAPEEAGLRQQRTREASTDRAPSPSGGSEDPSLASTPTPSRAAESSARPVLASAQAAPGGQAETGGAGAGQGAHTSPGVQFQAALGAGAAGAGGSAADAGRASGGQAGGVAAGSLGSSVPAPAPASSRGSGRSPRALVAARPQAEHAVSRDDIPPARRQYVRDYFLRLQSMSLPR
jgi:hypothetical protein